jgi:NitT/TauT family transport system ATP-binding protein
VLKIIKQHRKSAILVTHDIGEAVTMADRVMILSRRPGRIKRIVDIDLAGDERDPVRLRDNEKYQSYFQMLWDDLDH